MCATETQTSHQLTATVNTDRGRVSGSVVSSRVPRTTTRMHTHARVMESERWQPVIRQCGHKDTISLVYMSAKEPPRARVAGGSCCQPLLEGSKLLVESTGRAQSCLSKVPEGCCVHLRKYHRGFELSVAAVERTGGLLSCLS